MKKSLCFYKYSVEMFSCVLVSCQAQTKHLITVSWEASQINHGWLLRRGQNSRVLWQRLSNPEEYSSSKIFPLNTVQDDLWGHSKHKARVLIAVYSLWVAVRDLSSYCAKYPDLGKTQGRVKRLIFLIHAVLAWGCKF